MLLYFTPTYKTEKFTELHLESLFPSALLLKPVYLAPGYSSGPITSTVFKVTRRKKFLNKLDFFF